MAKKASASKKVTAKPAAKKPAAKAAPKAAAKAKAIIKPTVKLAAKATGKPTAKPTAKPATKIATKPPAKVAVKSAPASKAAAKPVVVKETPTEKPALMTKKGKAVEEALEEAPKDQGDLLIEKAKEEMFAINNSAKQAEKNSKIKPIKIERGNLADEKAKWQELFKRHGKEKAVGYKMTDSFDALKPLQHKLLGWGFVLSNENNRLEVLFENGIKMLISNYKPS